MLCQYFLDEVDATQYLCSHKVDLLSEILYKAIPLFHDEFLLSTLYYPGQTDIKIPNVTWSTIKVPCGCILEKYPL